MRSLNVGKLFPQNTTWTCRQCVQKARFAALQKAKVATRTGKSWNRSSERRGLVLAAAGGSLAASAAFLTDDLKHGYMAMERTGRVVGTLAVNINE